MAERTVNIPPEAVPRLVTALGGSPGESDPLELLAARYRDDSRHATRGFLEEAGIPCELWSRVGE